MFTLKIQHAHLEEIKKSRFIAVACPVASKEDALAQLAMIRDPEANHNCWAYKVGVEYRFSDDGEPGGTAGRPILTAIETQGLDHVLVVVTRFFGGTKLGAGGLIRAYGGVAAECLRTSQKKEVQPKVVITIEAPFDLIGSVYTLLEQFKTNKQKETYLENGLVLTVEIDQKDLESFETALADATRGKAVVTQSP